MLNSLLEIRFKDLVDICMVALLLWALIAWSRRVHANLALLGLAFLGGLYLVALQLELQLTAWIFQGFFAVLVILLVVVFQEDLRRLFEQIAVLGLRRRPHRSDTSGVAALYRALVRLARARTGALVVLEGREPLERHLQGGIGLGAAISEELLLSLFDPHSPGHDGAVLISGNRLVRFAVHLPLSEDRIQLGPGGTRHAAALGLAERSYALCVVVSEERGTISVAHQGELRLLENSGQLLRDLHHHQGTQGKREAERSLRKPRLRRRSLEGGVALALALASWMAFVPGSTMGEITREVPVTVQNMPEGYTLDRVEPDEVTVTVAGPQRELLLSQAADFEAVVDAPLVELGRRTFSISRDAIRHPTGLRVLAVSPEKVRLHVRRR
jgi:uncharacterized protein (TIGR00159 family)